MKKTGQKKKSTQILKTIQERLEDLTARQLEVQLHSTPYVDTATGENFDQYTLSYEGNDANFSDLRMLLGALDGIGMATSAHEGTMQSIARTVARTAASQLQDVEEQMAAFAEVVSNQHDEDLQVHVGRDGYELHFNEFHAEFQSAWEALAALQGVHVAIDWYQEQQAHHEQTHEAARDDVGLVLEVDHTHD